MKLHGLLAFALISASLLIFNTISLFAMDCNADKEKEEKEIKVVNNPIIQGLGVCDPHIHIFEDKAYLFASHDREPGAKFYGMYDWWVWSSSDLVHWELEFNLFPKDMWVGPTNNCWAVDGAERNGNYYFYVSGDWKTGVAISRNGPEGPYIDALKKPISSTSGTYDPTVYIDDDKDKTPYLIVSHYPYRAARLNEDMISLAEDFKKLQHDSLAWEGDGGYLHKHNGIYYVNGHGAGYASSENLFGPYTFRGKFYPTWIDHPMIFEWNNQTYCAFGRKDVDRTFRKTHITYVHYKENGDIVASEEVGESFIGVGQYDCSKKIEAEWYFAATDGTKKQEIEAGFAVSNLTDKACLYYPRILNLAADAQISIQVASAIKGGTIEVRQDSPDGEILGKIIIPNTKGLNNYQTVTSKIKSIEGLVNIYLVYKGKAPISIDWFTLSSTGEIKEPAKPDPIIMVPKPSTSTPAVDAFNTIDAVDDLINYSALRTIDVNENDWSKGLGFMQNKSYSSYLIDFGSNQYDSLTFHTRLASKKPGIIELRLESPDGELFGTCNFENSNSGWITSESKVRSLRGVHYVFLVIRTEEDEKYRSSAEHLRLNWFKFIK